MKNKSKDAPSQIIILNEEATSPKENKLNKLNGYMKKHYKILTLYMTLILILLGIIGIFITKYGSSKDNEPIKDDKPSTHVESSIDIKNSEGVIIGSPESTIIINK